jgi:hypothetical protein
VRVQIARRPGRTLLRQAGRAGAVAAALMAALAELGKNLPARMYRHPDFADLDAVEPAMGNHLLDTTTPELNGGEFTHTFIYGSWDGEITFYEPMVNLTEFEQLRSGEQADECVPIKAPRAWQRAGWYPTSYCLRHRDNRDETLTTLEDFVHRPAS